MSSLSNTKSLVSHASSHRAGGWSALTNVSGMVCGDHHRIATQRIVSHRADAKHIIEVVSALLVLRDLFAWVLQ
jgi:hypothetical protein